MNLTFDHYLSLSPAERKQGFDAWKEQQYEQRIAALETYVHALRVAGDRLALNVRDSAMLYPDNWNQPAVRQALKDWQKAFQDSWRTGKREVGA